MLVAPSLCHDSCRVRCDCIASYCYEDQCGASQGAVPVGAKLFDPALDKEFAQSIGGQPSLPLRNFKSVGVTIDLSVSSCVRYDLASRICSRGSILELQRLNGPQQLNFRAVDLRSQR